MLQVGVIVAFVVASAIYAAPSVIATVKRHRRWGLVVALNILLGWTIVGWLLALVIALGLAPKRPAWTKRTRKPRPRSQPAAARGTSVGKDLIDPPIVHEDVYEAWLDEGAAIPAGAEKQGSP